MATLKLTIPQYGSIERVYTDDSIINEMVDVQKEVTEMTEVIMNTSTYFN